MMEETCDWKSGTSFVQAVAAFLTESFPNMDQDREVFLGLCEHFEKDTLGTATVTLKEASFAKLFCDAYFMHKMRSALLAKKLGRPQSDPQEKAP